MVLESTIVCVDNSEWMRNGDFMPTRIRAQQDAVSVICHAKTRQNPENNVALMTSASLEVLVTLTTDVGRIVSKLHNVQPNGSANFLTGIKIAHLALKHRQGKNHRMRIVIFVGSPIEVVDKELTKVAKKLKKEKVNVDIVLLGENAPDHEKLTQFIETINGKEGTGSHLVVVPPSPSLTDALRTSPIVQGEDGYTPSGGGDFGSGFDVDPNLDPELALALRVSMEEQRQRQDKPEGDNTENTDTTTTPAPAQPAAPSGGPAEDALLMNAMYPGANVDFNAMTEEEQIALAIQMSMSDTTPAESDTKGDDGKDSKMETETETTTTEPMEEDQDYSEVMNDPALLQHLVASLPGVDPNSDAIQNALHALTGNQEEENKDDKDKKKDGDK